MHWRSKRCRNECAGRSDTWRSARLIYQPHLHTFVCCSTGHDADLWQVCEPDNRCHAAIRRNRVAFFKSNSAVCEWHGHGRSVSLTADDIQVLANHKLEASRQARHYTRRRYLRYWRWTRRRSLLGRHNLSPVRLAIDGRLSIQCCLDTAQHQPLDRRKFHWDDDTPDLYDHDANRSVAVGLKSGQLTMIHQMRSATRAPHQVDIVSNSFAPDLMPRHIQAPP